MKTYDSKDALYQDYAIALKLGLERRVHVDDYKDVWNAFARNCRVRVREFSRTVQNFRSECPVSAGFFVEIPVLGDTGQLLGTRFVLLEHETGWELFIPLAAAAAVTAAGAPMAAPAAAAGAWFGEKVAEKVLDKALDPCLDSLFAFFRESWSKLVRGGVRIDHVEFRSEKKGVARIAFSKFSVEQVRCMLDNFASISQLIECNKVCKCFNDQLVAVKEEAGPPQSND